MSDTAILVIVCASGMVFGWLIQPLLKRRVYCPIRSWWRFGRRRKDTSKPTTTTATFNEMLRPHLVQPLVEQMARDEENTK